jgi:flagellar hook-basal body complex protein FliE
MLLKISLGLAILVGLVTLFVTHVQVGGRIQNLTTTLTQTQQDLSASQQSEAQARTETKTVRGQLETTTRAFTQATNDLVQAQFTAEEQRQRADTNAAQLVEVTRQRNEAQQELSQWKVFGMTVDQIRNQLGRLRSVEQERDGLIAENKGFAQDIQRLKGRLARYEDVPPVMLPPGTKGNVVAVDPKYDFIVIDIGGNQGVLENANMLVNRDGKLIGKVRITQVEPDRSIANVIPEWKQDDIMEGDQVIF